MFIEWFVDHLGFVIIVAILLVYIISSIIFRVNSFQARLDNLSKEKCDLESTLHSKYHEIQTANLALSESAKREKLLNQELSAAKNNLLNLLAENDELKNSIVVLQNATSNSTVSVLAQTESDVSDFQKQLSDAKQYYEDKNEQQRSAMARTVSQLLETKARLEEEILFLKQQLEQSYARIDESDIRFFNLRQEVIDKKSELSTRQSDLEHKELEYSKKVQYLDDILRTLTCTMSKYVGYTNWYDFQDTSRIENMLNSSTEVLSIDLIQATVKSSDPHKKPYTTTLVSCECKDFEINLEGRSPCKHMYALAFYLGLLRSIPSDDDRARLSAYLESKKNIPNKHTHQKKKQTPGK